MSKRVLIIGAVALGPKVACRIKRLDPSFDVTLIDKDNLISYGGCGIPYYIGGDVAEPEGLRMTSAHVIRDSKYFETVKQVNVRISTEAISIDRHKKTLKVRNINDNRYETLQYDQLVLATGSEPIRPQLPNINLSGVFTVANLHNAKAIKDMISKGQVSKAVVIGGGAIGLEMAEALTDLWGIETTIVEMLNQLLPSAFGNDMSLLIQNQLKEKGVCVRLSEKVTKILGDNDNGVQGIELASGENIPCDLVILAVGVKPNVSLARDAGLNIGKYGIVVDEFMRTSDPSIYAGGDCVEIKHLISGESIPMPLGSLANREGRIIGTNIVGGNEKFVGTVGSFCLKVFDLGIARAGLTVNQAKKAGFEPVHSVVVQSDRAHFYPSMELMYLKLIADKKSKRLLGIEAIGKSGDAVKARVDAVVPLLSSGACVQDACLLEVCYAPPFASAMDIVNNAANALDNILNGIHVPVDVIDFLKLFEKGAKVLDVRNPIQSAPYVKKYPNQWQNINQEDLLSESDKLQIPPNDETLFLICGSGARSFETQILFNRKGIKNTKNIMGGIGMIKMSDLNFAPSEE